MEEDGAEAVEASAEVALAVEVLPAEATAVNGKARITGYNPCFYLVW